MKKEAVPVAVARIRNALADVRPMLSTGGKTTRQSREDKDPSPAGSLHIPPRKPRPPHTYHTLPSALADAEGPHLTNEERGPRRGWGGK